MYTYVELNIGVHGENEQRPIRSNETLLIYASFAIYGRRTANTAWRQVLREATRAS